ncbi:conjugative transposon protein TraM [Sphingobacterium shayense]|uniref:conjugative transposon protein TraM n=1 Tax=Sphingobacterium shayense TaxID=626343 RepID=UPI0015573DB6|nr:conjugative transposon protein TraM [Sphingobacterium shayense]NQD72328.1 conjugative transposon protein TraM [Sphingobacterium shayense]
MKINFKKPQVALPLIALPFVLIFFYAYRSLSAGKTTGPQPALVASDSLQGSLADVSQQVKSRPLASKLSAYRQQYRDGDGYTAIKQLGEDQLQQYRFDELYSREEKQRLDSIEKALKLTSPISPPLADDWSQQQREQDLAVQQALAALSQPIPQQAKEPEKPAADPMELFRMQMAYADSMAKANDPQLQQERVLERQQQLQQELQPELLPAAKYDAASHAFNTLMPQNKETPIQAIIDEAVTGTAESRIRIRLLDDMLIGGQHNIPSGTYLYARMSGFAAQRVMLSVTSILWGKTVLPVKLEIYDNDGAKGLYVPASAFREFSKELGSSSAQGLTLQQQAAGNAQMVMGTLQRMFQSTSSALSKQIRKNKAKIKYNSLVYLIDGSQQK